MVKLTVRPDMTIDRGRKTRKQLSFSRILDAWTLMFGLDGRCGRFDLSIYPLYPSIQAPYLGNIQCLFIWLV